MGTRNVTIVKLDGAIIATKYCQWDGYPTGQGLDLCKFIRKDLDLRKLKKSLRNATVISEGDAEILFDKYIKAVENVAYDKRKKIQEKLVPTLTRDTGGGALLKFIQERPELPLTPIEGDLNYATGKDEFSFGMEYAYEVDLDNKTVKVYDGKYLDSQLVETMTFQSIKRAKDIEKRMAKLETKINKRYND